MGISHLTWLAQWTKGQDDMVRAYYAGLGGAKKGRGGIYLAKVQKIYAALA